MRISDWSSDVCSSDLFGKFEYLGWVDRGAKLEVKLMPPGQASAGQKALLKFFVVVAALFLVQTLIGGAVAHYRADPGSFYGFQLETIFPSNLLRTWHLQDRKSTRLNYSH